jgi:hypothetical protein
MHGKISDLLLKDRLKLAHYFGSLIFIQYALVIFESCHS